MEKLLTIRELAERLGISSGTAYHWLSQGRLPCVRFSSRCVRFRESDVQKMLEQLGEPMSRDVSTENPRRNSSR
jgi:excisionase family DNA binding protein